LDILFILKNILLIFKIKIIKYFFECKFVYRKQNNYLKILKLNPELI